MHQIYRKIKEGLKINCLRSYSYYRTSKSVDTYSKDAGVEHIPYDLSVSLLSFSYYLFIYHEDNATE